MKKNKNKNSVNKELDKMLSVMADAKKDGQKSVAVFTTKRKHYKTKLSSDFGFSSQDLKPKFYEAYKYFLCQHDVTTRLLNPNELSVEWVIKLR
jgi:hypothetical protein